MRISRFQMKPGIKPNVTHMSPYGSFIRDDATHSIHRYLYDSVNLYVGFPDDISKWNDFDYVLVLDDDFCQPYTPFYNWLNGDQKGKPFPVLEKVILAYNQAMRNLPYLEEVKED